FMAERRVGLWLIGAFGGVGTTVALGLAAWRRDLIDTTSLVTALPLFEGLDLATPAQFVVGGHDIRQTNFQQTIREFQQRSNVFEPSLTEACLPDLNNWAENVRPGTILNTGAAIARLADLPEVHHADPPRAAIERIQADLRAFRDSQRLDQLVVINVASTEPPFELSDVHASLERFLAALDKAAPSGQALMPASSLYAWAAL